MEFESRNDDNSKRYSFDSATALHVGYIVCFNLGYTMITMKCSPVSYTMYLPPLIQKKQNKYMNKCNYLKPDTVMASVLCSCHFIDIDSFYS